MEEKKLNVEIIKKLSEIDSKIKKLNLQLTPYKIVHSIHRFPEKPNEFILNVAKFKDDEKYVTDYEDLLYVKINTTLDEDPSDEIIKAIGYLINPPKTSEYYDWVNYVENRYTTKMHAFCLKNVMSSRPCEEVLKKYDEMLESLKLNIYEN